MKSFPRWLIVASAIATLAFIGVGYWFYSYQEQDLRRNSEANLEAIAQLKVNQIAAWRSEQLGSILTLALAIGLLAFLVSALGMPWHKFRKAHYKELLLAERALRRAEEIHRITLMSVGDGIISTDIEGRVELVNPLAEALTGWRREEARGKPLEVVFRILNEETRALTWFSACSLSAERRRYSLSL